MFLSFAIECDSLERFLDYWSARYRDLRDPELYDPYVGKPMTVESRRRLFEWKNGSPLSARKSSSIEKYYPLSIEITELSKYLGPVAGGGTIWNIFYMHCVSPQTWPIFDQHTFRAMRFMKSGNIEELPAKKADVYGHYQTEYIPFVRALKAEQRKVDKALYTFGQFLKRTKDYR
jgi:hypothetical protein